MTAILFVVFPEDLSHRHRAAGLGVRHALFDRGWDPVTSFADITSNVNLQAALYSLQYSR